MIRKKMAIKKEAVLISLKKTQAWSEQKPAYSGFFKKKCMESSQAEDEYKFIILFM